MYCSTKQSWITTSYSVIFYTSKRSPNSLFSYSMSSEKSRNDQITILHSSGLEVGQWVTLVIDSSQHTWIHCCASALVTICPYVLDQCLSLHGQPVTPSTDRSILHIGKSYLESATRHEYPWHLATLCHCRDTDFYLKKKKRQAISSVSPRQQGGVASSNGHAWSTAFVNSIWPLRSGSVCSMYFNPFLKKQKCFVFEE